MNILQKNRKNKKLEEKISRFIDKAEENIYKNFPLGKRFLHQANRLYSQNGYQFNLETRLNKVVRNYMDIDLISSKPF